MDTDKEIEYSIIKIPGFFVKTVNLDKTVERVSNKFPINIDLLKDIVKEVYDLIELSLLNGEEIEIGKTIKLKMKGNNRIIIKKHNAFKRKINDKRKM